MRIFINISLIVLILTLTGSSCGKKKNKKYEEDPDFSKLTPHDRIKGSWFLDDFTFNGNSQVTQFNKIFVNQKDDGSGVVDIRNSVISVVFDNVDKKEVISLSRMMTLVENLSFDEEFISIPVSRIIQSAVSDSAVNMSFFSPMHLKNPNVINNPVKWRVTKLFDNNMNIVLDVDSGQFKMLFSKK